VPARLVRPFCRRRDGEATVEPHQPRQDQEVGQEHIGFYNRRPQDPPHSIAERPRLVAMTAPHGFLRVIVLGIGSSGKRNVCLQTRQAREAFLRLPSPWPIRAAIGETANRARLLCLRHPRHTLRLG
jgi:hypothetical protein